MSQLIRIAATVVTAFVSLSISLGQTPITSGNLVVLRTSVRNDSTAVARAVSLLELNPSNFSTVQTINVNSTTGDSARFTITGNSTAGGILSLNPNNTVTFAGYRADDGTASPGGATSATINRVIGSLDLTTGSVNTNLGLTNTYNSLTFRSAATADGQNFYLSGAPNATGGPQLVTSTGGLPATPSTISTSTALTTTTSNNTRQIQVAGGNVFLSSGAGTPGQQVFQVGTGTLTTGNQTLTASFGNQGTSNQYNSFTFARLGTGTTWNSTGFDTIYAVDNDTSAGSTVQKWSFNGTTWAAAGNISLAGANNIAVRQNSLSSVDLYVTTSQSSGSTIEYLNDATGFGGTLTGSFSTQVTASGANGFYGIVFVPVPEPATILGLAAIGLVGYRRLKRSTTRFSPVVE